FRPPLGLNPRVASGVPPNAIAPGRDACSPRQRENFDEGEWEMIHAGQTIENPVTGERLVFHETALQTGGHDTHFAGSSAPGGSRPTGHVYPHQTETFEIVSGTLTMRVDGRTIEAKAGETVVVEPGTAHDFWNKTDDVVHFKVEVRPALTIESLIET